MSRPRMAAVVMLGMLLAPGLAQAMAAWQHAVVLMGQSRLEEAVAYLEPRLAESPDNLPLLDAWVRLQAQRLPADQLAACLPPSDDPAARHFATAMAYLDQDDHEASRAALLAAAAAAPDSAAAAVALARAYRSAAFLPDCPDADTVRRRLTALLAATPAPPRFQAELDLLHAELAYLADQLDLCQATIDPLLAGARDQGDLRLAGRAHNILAGIAAKRRRLDQADVHYAAAESLARRLDDHDMLASVLVNRAYQASHRRDQRRSQELLAEAEQLTARWGLHRLRGAILAARGASAEMAGRRHEAVACFRQAAVLSGERHDTMNEIGSSQRLAYNLGMLGRYHDARHHYDHCLALLDAHDNQFIRNWVVAGLAIIEHKLGHLDRAAALYTEARGISLELGDHRSAAWGLQSLGLIQLARGHSRQALLTMHQARQQSELADDPEGMGEAHAAMAEVYLELGDHHRALDHGRRAFALAEQSDSEELLLRALRSLATAHAATGPADETTALYRRAIAIAHRWTHRVGEAEIWIDLAAHHLAHADTAAAVAALDQADQVIPDGAHHEVLANVALQRGRTCRDADQAARWARLALAEAELTGLPGLEWMAHSDLGWARHRAGHTDAGLEHQRRAVDLVEGLRWQAGTDELRRHMLRKASLPYERLVTQIMAVGRPDAARQALTVSEQARAQILAGRLRAAAAASGADTTQTTTDRSTVALTFLQSRLQEGDLPPADRDSLRRRVAAIEREAALVRLQQPAQPLAPGDSLWCGRNLAPDEHALCYVLADQGSFLFSVSRDGVQAYPLPPRSVLEAQVQRYLDLPVADLPADILATARAGLHRLLLAPALADIPADARLVLVPDGLLHRLPFVNLGDPEPLIRRHAVCRAPSLQTLGALRRLPQRTTTAVVAVGSRGGGAGRRHPFRDEPIRALPSAEDEARHIAGRFQDASLLAGDQATEDAVREQLGSARLIHVAAHSDVNHDDVRRTHLVLTRDPDGHDDGLLMWPEIAGLRLQADLVTLAACRSADGVLARGEGIGGLAQAFLHAGARCVLGSTVDLGDRDARRLMERFYHHLSTGLTAAAALRQVQLELLNPGTRASLRAAGEALVLVGDGAVTLGDLPDASPRRRLALTVGPVAAVLIGCVILLRRRSKR